MLLRKCRRKLLPTTLLLLLLLPKNHHRLLHRRRQQQQRRRTNRASEEGNLVRRVRVEAQVEVEAAAGVVRRVRVEVGVRVAVEEGVEAEAEVEAAVLDLDLVLDRKAIRRPPAPVHEADLRVQEMTGREEEVAAHDVRVLRKEGGKKGVPRPFRRKSMSVI